MSTKREFKFGEAAIDISSFPLVVAELGHNFGAGPGRMQRLFQMIDVAKECGCDAVKLQKRNNKKIFTKDFYDAPYNSENSYGSTYGEHREVLELTSSEFKDAFAYAKEQGLIFFSTAFDEDSSDFLIDIGVKVIKIASGDCRNLPLIRHIAKTKTPMIISTGGTPLEMIKKVDAVLLEHDCQGALLHCVASYPNKAKELNLRAILTLLREFPNRIIGLSDHYNGIVIAPVAFCLGARIIEKHFTLDHTWKGGDNALSLQPAGMLKMVRDLERVAIALGTGEKEVLPSEIDGLKKMAKSVYTARAIKEGEVISSRDLVLKTPWLPCGLNPHEMVMLVGLTAPRDLPLEYPIMRDEVTFNQST